MACNIAHSSFKTLSDNSTSILSLFRSIPRRGGGGVGRPQDPVEFQELQEGEVGEGRHPLLTPRLRARLQRPLPLRLHHDSNPARFAPIVNKNEFWDRTSELPLCLTALTSFMISFASWRE